MKTPSIPAAAALARGELVAVADDLARVPRALLVLSAAHASAERMNELVTLARGVVCVGITRDRARALGLLDEMAVGNEHAGAFTRSVEAASGVSTGISAADRARTVRVLAQDGAGAEALVSPGHIFPVIAHDAGVLGRAD